MKIHRLIVVLCAALAALSLSAQTYIAYQVPAGTTGNQAIAGLGVGNDFRVMHPIMVSQLGVFNSGANGITGNAELTVQLYERNGKSGLLLESLTFDATSPGTQVGGSLFKPLSQPVTLLPGEYSIVAYGFDTNNPEGNAGKPPYNTNATIWSVNDGGGLIQFLGSSRYGYGGVSQFPGRVDKGPANRYAAGTFVYAAANLSAPAYAQDYAFLTAGVANFPIGDTRHLGSIAVFNDGSFPVVAEHGGNRLIMEAAGRYNGDPNGARAVVFSHVQWEHAENDSRMVLFENAIKWAAKKSNPADITIGLTVNVSTNFSQEFDFNYFLNRGYNVIPVELRMPSPTNDLPGMDVLVADWHAHYDQRSVNRIEKFTANGGGLVMSVTPRFIIYTKIRPSFYAANEILAPFGLGYRPSLATPGDNSFTNVYAEPYPEVFSAFPAAWSLYQDRMGQAPLDSLQKAMALNTITYSVVGQPALLTQLTAAYSGLTNTGISYPGNAGDLVAVASLTGSQTTTNQAGNWVVEGKDLVAEGRRGTVEYQFAAPAADMYQVLITGAQALPYSPVTNFNLVLSVDGQGLGRYTLNADPSGGSLACLLPFLTVGPHTLRIHWDNSASGTSLRLKEVDIQSRLGPDSSGTGIKDWVGQVLQQQSGMDLTNQTIGSYTSPVCIEGRDPYPTLMNAYVEGADNNVTALTPHPLPDQRWFVNVPLSAYANASVDLHVGYQNGGLSEDHQLQWLPLNLLSTSGSQTIRQGDSLLFNASPSTNAPTGKLIVTIGTNQLTGKTSQPIAYRFTNPGTYTITGTYVPSKGSAQSGGLTVNVIGHTFSSNPDCWVGHQREWDLFNVPAQAVITADSSLFFEQGSALPTNGVRTTLVTDVNQSRYIVSQLGVDGPVLDVAKASGFQLNSGGSTYTRTLTNYVDGSQLVEMMVVLSPVPSDLTVRLDVIVGGVMFDDGTTSKTLAAADFDTLGQAVVRFIRPAGCRTSVCHSISVFQGSTLICYTR